MGRKHIMRTKLSSEQAQKIVDMAGKILEETGIKVIDDGLREELGKRKGLQKSGDRICISLQKYEEFLEEQKHIKTPVQKHGNRLRGEASLYPYQYRNPEDGKIRTYSMETLGEYATFVEKASHKYPLNPVICGYPKDVPQELSSLARYKISVENCSASGSIAPDSEESAPYIFEMAEVMGEKAESLPVYMVSPLTYGGDSLNVVLKNCCQIDSFYVFTMPNLGVTTPMNLHAGFAMALAEVVGGAIFTQELTGLRGEIRPNLFPFDFRSFNIAFGSAEKFLIEQMAASLCAFIHEEEPDYSSTNIHTWGKEADGRTAMEKGMMIMAGAIEGARKFYCVGALSLDEVFDPLQMIQDLEAISFAQRILDGLPQDYIEDVSFQELREGIQEGFLGSDRSLEEYNTYVKPVAISPKDTFQTWKERGQKTHRELLREVYREICESPRNYYLAEEKQKELNKIYKRAMKNFGGY